MIARVFGPEEVAESNILEMLSEGDWPTFLVHPQSGPEYAQTRVLVRALQKYVERNEKYKDNWKRMGYRGMLVRIRERAERLWDSLWDGPSQEIGHEEDLDLDDAIDLINFAAFLVRGAEQAETTRDGSWWS